MADTFNYGIDFHACDDEQFYEWLDKAAIDEVKEAQIGYFKMVQEVSEVGLSNRDLTNPEVYDVAEFFLRNLENYAPRIYSIQAALRNHFCETEAQTKGPVTSE